MAGMLKRLITTGALIGALMFTTSVEAQSSITVTRNGKTYIVVTARQNRCETPRRHRARPHNTRYCSHRVHRRSSTFRYMRHVNRFYHGRNHARHRCYYCIQYTRWLDRDRHIRCGYDPVIHIYRHRH